MNFDIALPVKGCKTYLGMVRMVKICCLLMLPFFVFGQTPETKRLLERAKAEMKKSGTGDQPDYISAGKWLEEVVKADTNNAEAWYYYGCAIDRYNHADGEGITASNVGLTENTSLAFENCLHISNDKYTGDILLLDPHTKLLAAWGAQALSYLNKNNIDSAVWCLKQAEEKGGINKTVAVYFKQVLDECGHNAYLFTTGDMYTYYLLYLQYAEHYRQDVTCIDLNLLNTFWYPKWLGGKAAVQYSYTPGELDKIGHARWDEKEVAIPVKNENYTDSSIVWLLKPTHGAILLRSDRILLDILQQNAFEKPVYFAGDVPPNMRLYVDSCLQTKGLTDRLMPYVTAQNEAELTARLKKLPVLPYDGTYLNNQDDIQVLNNYRFAYTTAAIIASKNGHGEEARQLIDASEGKYPETLLPFFAGTTKQWFVQLKKKAEEGEKL
jgi:hypothetical protein